MSASQQQVKENANPVIHAVESSKSLKANRASFLGHEELDRYFHLRDGGLQLSGEGASTSIERSVYSALHEIMTASSISCDGHDHHDNDHHHDHDQDDHHHSILAILHHAGLDSCCRGSDERANLRVLSAPPIVCSTYFESDKRSSKEPSSSSSTTTAKTDHDAVTREEIFWLIRNIQDPEHPLTLEQLNVVNVNHIQVQGFDDGLDDSGKDNSDTTNHPTPEQDEKEEQQRPLSLAKNKTRARRKVVLVEFTPTIPHCSMATLIGLTLRVKLLQSLPRDVKISVKIRPGTHASEQAINKQLQDKERVCAALENPQLLKVVHSCIKGKEYT